MRSGFINIAASVLPEFIKDFLLRCRHFIFWDRYQTATWAQEGEDLILGKLFGDQKMGFYVDVGAHHPQRFSNTCLFYKRGWRGINIDASPGSMTAFRKLRKRDINLEVPIGSESKVRPYYVFNEPALNSFDNVLSKDRNSAANGYRIIKTLQLRTRTLADVLDEYLPPHQQIDFLSIDVEGLDVEVLKSNDWTKYRPKVVLVEILEGALAALESSEVASFLAERNYVPYAKAANTVIFRQATK